MMELTKTNNCLGVLIMATRILSENPEIVLSCHQGLSAEEITQDCLEKAKALAQVGFGYLTCPESDSNSLPAAYLSLLDDILELALKYHSLIGASSQRCQALSGQVLRRGE
jgi:hypothetical protein